MSGSGSMFTAAAVSVRQLGSSTAGFSQTISSSSSELDDLTDFGDVVSAPPSPSAVAVAASVM